jgi:hypothetical protein
MLPCAALAGTMESRVASLVGGGGVDLAVGGGRRCLLAVILVAWAAMWWWALVRCGGPRPLLQI